MSVWDRRDDETPKSFAAFTFYRDLGIHRSLDRAYQRYMAKRHNVAKSKFEGVKAVGQWSAWSRRYDWVGRAAAYDDWVDQQVQERVVAREVESRANMIREMNDRHTAIAKAMQNKVVQRLTSLDAKELKPFDVKTWFEGAMKAERLIVGIVTENVKSELVGRDGEPLSSGAATPVVILLPDNGRDPHLKKNDD